MSEAGNKLPADGDVIAGKYRVNKVLGVGGMGCVVAAHHLLLNQKVAMKFVLPEGAGKTEYTARFFLEAQAAAAMKSEHVVRVLDMGTLENGLPYMVMEYLDGIDLGALLAGSGPLPVSDAVNYTLQACEALAEAHAAGFTHRDIKPSNLFLTHRSDGSPLIKLLDFGIAKVQGAVDGKLTATGAVMGSPQYMSPEQVRDAKSVDGRSDIWSLGAALFELLTGQPAFMGTTFSALCAAIVSDPPPSLTKIRSDAPEALAKVIERCLEKDASKRYEDVGALAMSLLPFAGPRAAPSVERIVRIVKGPLLSDPRLPELSSPRISLTPKTGPGGASPFDETAAASSAVIGVGAQGTTLPAVARRRRLLAVALAAVGAVIAVSVSMMARVTVTSDIDVDKTTATPPASQEKAAASAASVHAVTSGVEPVVSASAAVSPSAQTPASAVPSSQASAPKVFAGAPPVIQTAVPAVTASAVPRTLPTSKGTSNVVDPFGSQH